jgi:hypothetical protein
MLGNLREIINSIVCPVVYDRPVSTSDALADCQKLSSWTGLAWAPFLVGADRRLESLIYQASVGTGEAGAMSAALNSTVYGTTHAAVQGGFARSDNSALRFLAPRDNPNHLEMVCISQASFRTKPKVSDASPGKIRAAVEEVLAQKLEPLAVLGTSRATATLATMAV